MDTQVRLQTLFAKYLKRSCTPEEVEELIALMQNPEATEGLKGPMLALWHRAQGDRQEYPVDWDKMYSAVSKTEDDLQSIHRRRNNRQPVIGLSLTWNRVAAVFILITVISAAYWGLTQKGNTRAGKQPAGLASADRPSMLNKKQILHLPDGSTVILNADSKLDYPAAFAGKTREVYLSGEAYFDIVHAPGKPFLVHTGKITTRVLGTAFDIKAYPAEETIEVTVTHGKVQVLKENRELGLLTDNQQIHLSRLSEDYSLKEVDVKPIISWKPEEVRFDDMTMLDAATRIGQRFNVSVEFVNPAIKGCRVTATFYEDDMLNEIMTVICGVSQSNFTILNNKVIIDGKGCN